MTNEELHTRLGDCPPPSGKDYNDHLRQRLGIPITKAKPKKSQTIA